MVRTERSTRMPLHERRFKINFKFRRKRGEKEKSAAWFVPRERGFPEINTHSFKINFKSRRKMG